MEIEAYLKRTTSPTLSTKAEEKTEEHSTNTENL